MRALRFITFYSAITALLLLSGCSDAPCGSGAGNVLDEAQCAGVKEDQLSGSTNDYYADMDYGISKNPKALQARLAPFFPGISEEDAVKRFARGRNNWIVWTAGNDRFWDELSQFTFGNSDLLKTISNHPELGYSRDNRWEYLGVVNEPCFTKANSPRADRYGLWLDVRDENCQPDPFENADEYPGIKIGARGENIEVGSYYGYGTGIVGLRLFPNPEFDEQAEANWDPVRYYTDPDYYDNKDLIRPYRVGMSCGFCHVGPNPTNPPQDFNNPEWANLNSNPGAQYFWVDRILLWRQDESNYLKQLFHASKPGALDTSLVSTDYINNPRTMNAIYNLASRLELSTKWGKENIEGPEQDNKQLNDFLPDDHALSQFYDAPDTVYTPRVLKDGADSVGALGALNRVYVNIGLFSEEWLEHFRPVVGGKKITPFPIASAQKNSAYWRANENQTADVALFFLGSAEPDYLKNAPGGSSHLTDDEAQLTLGKEVFASTCARCHSSKLPDYVFQDFFPDKGCVNNNYLKCWNDYWQHTKTDQFKSAMEDIVQADDFLDNNFLSNELRVPLPLLETNACSPLARNGLAGDIWDNFTSSSYKSLPPVGTINVQNPYTGELRDFTMPGGGRGYTRPASLISLWSSAPFLLNNALGPFEYQGTVDARMKSFNESIERLLWPEQRAYSGQDDQYDYDYPFEVITRSGKKHPGYIQVTQQTTHLNITEGYLPKVVAEFEGILAKLLPKFFSSEGITLGPIPAGTPVNLLYNTDLGNIDKQRIKLLVKIIKDLKKLPADATDEQAKAIFANLVDPLLKNSSCPDYVTNKGHYFGTDYLPDTEEEAPLSDEEKFALIEFLKTL
ncbi:hypothetical protein KO507_09675 [Gilvimarinus agarilyticus]|uniref:hypothetical protein n=1 Tax=unclassified Gilvimarinus TaxID=2642066 RepID=UPI001C09563D|nr:MULTISPECIES: hypothetical protein [unclassified Gilvimarinus]MBU2886029.1 hypothetical protein [Gilvimarinus agarilyticus]MDO6570775.1 hypothetical protein [Gilvimarinus sp. 2_MG-2023]MDO6747632.1 hypothetical protein [Gilvimarinus sp. 1_MG-2023]